MTPGSEEAAAAATAEASGPAVSEVLASSKMTENGSSSPAEGETRSPMGVTTSPNGKSKPSKQQLDVGASGNATSTSEFVSVLGIKISELEKVMTSGSLVEREASKARKKQLREVSKYVADKSNSAEDRVSFLMSKYTTMVTEFLKMEKHHHEVQRDLEVATKERDKVQTELKKANAFKDKLEELCRVLQRENKEVVEDAKRRSEEDVKQRQALQQKFTLAINDVNVKMDSQQAERNKQTAENDALRGKLNDVLQQFETFNQMINKKDLEVQLANAKFEQQQQINEQLGMKADLLMAQNEQLIKVQQDSSKEIEGFVLLKDQNVALLEANKELKQQLEHYYTKFADFQGTLTKSNQMFSNLKKELEGHHKVRAKLVKERDEMKRRCDQNDDMVAKLQSERNSLRKQVASLGGVAVASGEDEEIKKLRLQKERLEGLCRALQTQLAAARGRGAVEEIPSNTEDSQVPSDSQAAKAGSSCETDPASTPSGDASKKAAAQASTSSGDAEDKAPAQASTPSGDAGGEVASKAYAQEEAGKAEGGGSSATDCESKTSNEAQAVEAADADFSLPADLD